MLDYATAMLTASNSAPNIFGRALIELAIEHRLRLPLILGNGGKRYSDTAINQIGALGQAFYAIDNDGTLGIEYGLLAITE